MSTCDDLLRRVRACPGGKAGWAEFEDSCTALLTHLFVPPLQPPKIQARTILGSVRRDALFPNRDFGTSTIWGLLWHELDARMILVEYKNYDAEEIDKDHVNQTRNYLTKTTGRLGLLCCNKEPIKSAYVQRSAVFNEDKKVILFLTPDHLQEMCFIKERRENPADLIMDLVEIFYAEHQ